MSRPGRTEARAPHFSRTQLVEVRSDGWTRIVGSCVPSASFPSRSNSRLRSAPSSRMISPTISTEKLASALNTRPPCWLTVQRPSLPSTTSNPSPRLVDAATPLAPPPFSAARAPLVAEFHSLAPMPRSFAWAFARASVALPRSITEIRNGMSSSSAAASITALVVSMYALGSAGMADSSTFSSASRPSLARKSSGPTSPTPSGSRAIKTVAPARSSAMVRRASSRATAVFVARLPSNRTTSCRFSKLSLDQLSFKRRVDPEVVSVVPVPPSPTAMMSTDTSASALIGLSTTTTRPELAASTCEGT